MPSEFPDHFVHLSGIDGGVIPANAVASGDQVATDLTVSHAANELVPGGLQSFTEGDARRQEILHMAGGLQRT